MKPTIAIEVQRTGSGWNDKPVLQETSRRGQEVIRALGAQQDEIDLLRTASA